MGIAPVVSPLAQTPRHRLFNRLSILPLRSLTTTPPRPYILLRLITIGNTASMGVELPRIESLILMWFFCPFCFLRLCYAARSSLSPLSRFYPFTRLGLFALFLLSDWRIVLCSRFAPVIISVSPAFINVQCRLSRYHSRALGRYLSCQVSTTSWCLHGRFISRLPSYFHNRNRAILSP